MQKDSNTAAAITAATAAASALSYLFLTATTKAERYKRRDLLLREIENGDGHDGHEGDGITSIDRRQDQSKAILQSTASTESNGTNVKSIKTSASTETGATAEGDDTIYELADEKEIFGSASFYSNDSDSDLSYEEDAMRPLKEFLDKENSFNDLAFDSGHIELDPDHPLNSCIYLDYNGTTPVDRRVFASMIPYFTLHFGNPSSSHAYGATPKQAVSKARRSILELLHPNDTITEFDDADVDESIIFTGCGTEADNMAIHLALDSTPTKKRTKKHIVTTNVEHPAITECLKILEAKGDITVTYVPVNREGIVSARQVIKAITSETVLVTIMLANNESGALQPVKDIAPYCRKRGILFHTDAAQAVGKVSLALDDKGISDVDMVTIVGHKFGAPKGIACLYIRPGCLKENGRKEPTSCGYRSSGLLLLGGGQEGGRRAGTENVPYIVGMGYAANILTAYTSKKKHRRWRKNASKMRSIRSRLLNQLRDAFRDIDKDIVRENGPKDSTKRLPNTLSVGFKNVHSGELLKKIQSTVACSAGSACHASGGKVSGVLVAMKVPMEYARGTLRLSVGPSTTIDEVDKAAEIIIEEIKRQLKITS